MAAHRPTTPPAEAAPALRLRGVSLRLERTTVLAAVDWQVGPGERWVVLGPNGAGKTTLLRIAALYQHPSTGTVEVLGQTLGRCDVRELRRRVAFSSAALAARLAPGISALEVVMTARYAALAPWWHRYGDDDRDRAAGLLDRFGCAGVATHAFATLSAGERQRVLLARTLFGDPGLVLLDEPTAGLDLGGREQLVADLSRLADDPTAAAIVLVTHHLEEIPPGFTHGLLLRAGAVVAAGPLAEVLDDARLSACFELPLRVERSQGRWTARLAAGGGRLV